MELLSVGRRLVQAQSMDSGAVISLTNCSS